MLAPLLQMMLLVTGVVFRSVIGVDRGAAIRNPNRPSDHILGQNIAAEGIDAGAVAADDALGNRRGILVEAETAAIANVDRLRSVAERTGSLKTQGAAQIERASCRE